jgi:nucleotide-binding universal stress UspA family protein
VLTVWRWVCGWPARWAPRSTCASCCRRAVRWAIPAEPTTTSWSPPRRSNGYRRPRPPYRPTSKVTTHVSFNESFAEGLILECARLQAEALVVGAAGDGLIGRYSVGSVTGELLYCAPGPLALAPRGTRHSTIERVREVTCALGRRQGGDLLLDYAVRASAAAGTPLRLVSVVALDPVFGALRADDEAVRTQAVEHAALMLDAAKAELPEGFPVTSTVADGPTIESAVNKLEWHDGDLIMVGSSRLAAPRRLFLGSTAGKMLSVLEVPMVVVPRAQFTEEDLP